MYEDPVVDVLSDSQRRLQLAAAMGQNYGHENLSGIHGASASQSDRVMSADCYASLSKDPQWQEYRRNLESAALTSPLLQLTISSSATLNKGEVILINSLGLISHASKRTNPTLKHNVNVTSVEDPNQRAGGPESQDDPENLIQGSDMRDGFVFFGCKKSLK